MGAWWVVMGAGWVVMGVGWVVMARWVLNDTHTQFMTNNKYYYV